MRLVDRLLLAIFERLRPACRFEHFRPGNEVPALSPLNCDDFNEELNVSCNEEVGHAGDHWYTERSAGRIARQEVWPNAEIQAALRGPRSRAKQLAEHQQTMLRIARASRRPRQGP